MSDRFSFPRSELRRRTLRGVVVTSGFMIAIDGLVLIQGLVVTRLLGPSEIGLYGIVSTFVVSIVALKRVGIDEAFVQQEESDQEAEFQRAFTLELALGTAFTAIICALAPAVAAVYRDARLLPLTLALAYLPLTFALQAPMWIFFRRMDYARQRSLQATQLLVGLIVTVPLAAATGLGVWSIVIGQVAGYIAAVAAGLAVSPHRLRLRFDRVSARRYLRFSGPVLVATLGALAVAQGQVLAFKLHAGLAAAGFITLAVTLTRYVDRADQIVTSSIYPAICAIQDRPEAQEELFVKSNRATLAWVLPFSAAVVLFAPDLVSLVLGDRWQPAVVLLQGLAVAGAIQQLGFNWFSFYRARGQTRPPAVEAVVGALAFAALAVPGLLVDGSDGFVIGRVAAVVIATGVRWFYVRRLLPGVRASGLLAPALIPLAQATIAVMAVRLATWGGDRELWQALVEAALFVGVYGISVWRRERALIGELLTAMR
ncbi:MAG TPA: oligosaccharide flippase family protein [Solirubrobacteraceae bacterium]|nr:oligosaccharide flippase family protein [Solirubrobacteraceae bacterium]